MTPDIPRPKLHEPPLEGAVTMDGTEQILVLDEMPMGFPRYLEGYIDLSPLEGGDTLIIRQYIKIEPDGPYTIHGQETYTGEQALKLLYIHTKPSRYGIMITAQQTGGTFKTLRYQFFKRRMI